MGYRTVARRAQHEQIVKGSRFLAVVAPVAREAEALELLDELRRAHPDAHHHCSAWRFAGEMRFDDDGEPGGTAGRPMLEVILKRGLDRVAAVVVRTFGGTKLGAGGLVRAYTGAVARALDAAGTRQIADVLAGTVHAPFSTSDEVHRLLSGWPELRLGEAAFDAGGLKLPVRFRAEERLALTEALAGATRGRARLELDEPTAD